MDHYLIFILIGSEMIFQSVVFNHGNPHVESGNQFNIVVDKKLVKPT